MPSSLAFAFIFSTNCSSDPPIASASTMAASLPDCTMTPRIRSSTLTVLPSCTNIFEPCIRQAFSRHRQLVVQLQPALLELVIHEVQRHQLGHRRRRHLVVRLLFQQRGAGVEVLDVGPPRGRIDRPQRRVRGAAGSGTAASLPLWPPAAGRAARGMFLLRPTPAQPPKPRRMPASQDDGSASRRSPLIHHNSSIRNAGCQCLIQYGVGMSDIRQRADLDPEPLRPAVRR